MSAAAYPPPRTVAGRCIGALLAGQRLTSLDIWRRFGSSRASHAVYILRGLGWAIQSENIAVRTSDLRVAHIARYWLDSEARDHAGERGQRFATETARIEQERRAA